MKMIIRIWIYPSAIIVMLSMLIIGCPNDEDNYFPPPDTVADIDGNVYHTVTIGTQEWMVENLKTTKLNNGTSIPLVTDNVVWGNLSTPGYCLYNNDAANKNSYGALYNFYAVNTGKLAPTGWHVPTDVDWTTLIVFLGGDSIAGGKLKEVGTTHWLSPNKGATNETGFSALPGGFRDDVGSFSHLGGIGSWWSSTLSSFSYAYARFMFYGLSDITRYENPDKGGLSVRCVKD